MANEKKNYLNCLETKQSIYNRNHTNFIAPTNYL